MATAIPQDVRDVLSRSTIEGTLLRLPDGQLERSLYAATDKVLKMLGGKWDRRKGGHAFPFDPTEKIEAALGDGKVVSRQQALQHFDTPSPLADRLVAKLGHIGGKVCLEPSAGRGNIVAALAHRDPSHITAVEIDEDNVAALAHQHKAHFVALADFLKWTPRGNVYDAVAMNPPFRGNQDIRHVRQAFDFLKSGGILAAIVSEHGFLGKERECVEWREWLAELGAQIEIVPAGAFKESGTSVQTRMIVVRKPLTPPPPTDGEG